MGRGRDYTLSRAMKNPPVRGIVFSWLGCVIALCAAQALAAPVKFEVKFDESVRAEPATGRLVIYLNKATLRGLMHKPADGFVEEDPQPIFGIDVSNLRAGETIIVDDAATAFPKKLSELPVGKYRAQAVLDMKNENSEWERENGNLSSDVVTFDIATASLSPVKIELKHVAKEIEPKAKNVEFVTVRSQLLSDFQKRDVFLRAGVALPMKYDRNRSYPAVYEVPGYGGDHTMAVYKAARRANRPKGSAAEEIAQNTFWIFLDPESPHGHTLCLDSDNNGPVGKALITELIPALEKRFNLIAEPSARIVTGHSSGGWSSLWLATEYPDVFGACWSSSPDPVDFRRLELVDIYSSANMYTDANGREYSGARFGGKITMTTREENGMEQVLGTHNNTQQQWDSWQACWGHRDSEGGVKPLFDALTGEIDREEAESYRRFDIADRLRKDPKRFAPIFRDHIRLVCGENDTYFLNEAVGLLKADLEKVDPADRKLSRAGYIKLVPGDHQSVTDSGAMKAWAREMMDHLRQAGHVKTAATTRPS
ncbi:alpha/beta hydrolase-fold protein [soil metagenome]